MIPGLTSICRQNRSPHAMRTAAVAVGRSVSSAVRAPGPFESAREGEKKRRVLSKGFCSHGRSLGAQCGQFGDNQRSLSLRFCPFVLSIFHPSPLACCPLFRDRRETGSRRRPWPCRVPEEAVARRRGAPPTPVRFCGSFERTAEDASPRDKNLFPLEVNGILYDVISCIKGAGSAALLRANS